MHIFQFFEILYYSSTSVTSYTRLLKKSNRSIAIYVVFWFILLSLVRTLYFANVQIPTYTLTLRDLLQQADTAFPTDLEITWDGATLSTSRQISVPFPTSTSSQDSYPDYITLITPESEWENSSNASNYLSIITPTQLFVQNTENQWQEYPLTSLLPPEEFTITQHSFRESLSQLYTVSDTQKVRITVVLGILYFCFLSVAFIFILAWRLLLVVLLLRILGYSLSLLQMARVTALASIPALVVSTIAQLFYTQTHNTGNLAFWCIIFLFALFGKYTNVPRREHST